MLWLPEQDVGGLSLEEVVTYCMERLSLNQIDAVYKSYARPAVQ